LNKNASRQPEPEEMLDRLKIINWQSRLRTIPRHRRRALLDQLKMLKTAARKRLQQAAKEQRQQQRPEPNQSVMRRAMYAAKRNVEQIPAQLRKQLKEHRRNELSVQLKAQRQLAAIQKQKGQQLRKPLLRRRLKQQSGAV